MRHITGDDLHDGVRLLCVVDEDDVHSWVGKICYVKGELHSSRYTVSNGNTSAHYALEKINGVEPCYNGETIKFILYNDIPGKDLMKYKMTGRVDHLL